MNVVVFSPFYPPAYRAGGPVKSVSNLVRASRPPFSVRVVSRNWDLGERLPLRPAPNTWVAANGESVWACDPGFRHYAQTLRAVARVRPHLVYVNSLFDPWMAIIPALAWRVVGARRSDLVIAPRGQLAPGALAKSASRKRVMLALWRRVVRHRHAVIHAATVREQEDIERVSRCASHRAPQRRGPATPRPPRTNRPDRAPGRVPGEACADQGALELLRSLRGSTSK